MEYQLPLILYDPECPLCLRFKQGLSLMTDSIHFYSARDELIYDYFPELDRKLCLESVHMITTNKKILIGPEVINFLLENLPGVSKLSWLLDNKQGEKVKKYFYEKVEELRVLTTKKDSDCEKCPRE